MKTAKEWAEYLPLDIKLCFIEECERQEINTNVKIKNLSSAILWLSWSGAELGGEFWEFVWELACDYKGREEQILKDLEWIDDGKVAPKKKKKSKEDKIELAVMFFNENQELEKENAEFKKRHKSLLKANQESMERRVQLGDANSSLQSKVQDLETSIFIKDETIKVIQQTINIQDEIIETLNKQVADLKTEKENSIWSKIKNLCN